MKEGCKNRVWGKGYCQSHQYLRPDYKRPQRKPFSDKRTEINKEYYAQSREFIKEHPNCVVTAPGCAGKSKDVHHLRGRGRFLLDKSTWLAVCRNCHEKIERDDKWARENGYKKSKHIGNGKI